jgi:ERO1-like protein beta
MCDYETVESVSDELYLNLHELVHTPFFKYFQVHSLSRVIIISHML